MKIMFELNNAVIPFALPLIGAIVTLFRPKFRFLSLIIFFISVCYSTWLCVETYSGKIFVTSVGGWLAPYGITLAIDAFSALMLFFSNIIFFLAAVYGLSENSHIFRLPLMFLLQAGVSLSFITADFFNLFVSFEILLTSSYALLLVEVPKESRGQVFPYVMINVVGSFLFLIAAGMAYGETGHLNMAALHLNLAENSDSPLVLCLGIAALVIYGLKAGLFPFYFWLPAAYPLLPYSLAGLFSGVLTKVGVYVLIRLFVTVLPHSLDNLHGALLGLSGLTMFLGVLGAMCQKSIKNILSYHILSQVGYMALGLGLFTANALAAGLLFIVHNIVVKSSLFWIGGEVSVMGGAVGGTAAEGIGRSCGVTVDELGKIKALWSVAPFLGVCFLFQALSLAGIPPLSGFWGKYLLFTSTFESGHYILLVVALVTSFWTLFSMVKIWLGAFWGEDQEVERKGYLFNSLCPILLSVIFSLALGLGIELAYKVSIYTANQLFDPSIYVKAVLGNVGIREGVGHL